MLETWILYLYACINLSVLGTWPRTKGSLTPTVYRDDISLQVICNQIQKARLCYFPCWLVFLSFFVYRTHEKLTPVTSFVFGFRRLITDSSKQFSVCFSPDHQMLLDVCSIGLDCLSFWVKRSIFIHVCREKKYSFRGFIGLFYLLKCHNLKMIDHA